MNKQLFYLFVILSLTGCIGQKRVKKAVIEQAKTYTGVPYRYGGTSYQGIDCSGLILQSMNKVGIQVPRKASQQAEHFKQIKFSRIRSGDLVFFVTSGNYINHAGIVVGRKGKRSVQFLHASTSKGVRTDDLFTNYWSNKFVKAVRPNYKIAKK